MSNSKMYKRTACLLFIIILFLSAHPVSAQEQTGPVYIVQAGDSLSSIAVRFNIPLKDLMNVNGISNPDLLAADQQLIIPGLEGITGILDTEIINFGDSYQSLVRRTQIPELLLKKLNRLVSPSEFYVGASMIIPKQENGDVPGTRLSPAEGESLFELAIKHNSDSWTLAGANYLAGTWDGLPSDVLYARSSSGDQTAIGLPFAFISAKIRDLPIKQGGTGVVIVQTQAGVTLSGLLVDHQLHFFPNADGTQVALQGVHALLPPGVYPLRIDATLPDGSKQSYEQMVLIVSGNYPEAIVNGVDPLTLDPKVIDPENEQILSIVSPITSETYWQAPFTLPVEAQFCIRAWFGERRSYNSGTYNNFHAGVDYGVCSETHPFDVYTPAAGIVVFTGNLVVCGNATIIDHGQGIYSQLCHQEEFYVSAGERVQAGQLVGKIGETGRANGPHLHWGLWVNGIQVDPLDWLNQTYP